MSIVAVDEATGVTVRLATSSDYDDVMAIDPNMYGGMDYLPVKYMNYIRDPNRLMVVWEKDGQIVSVLC